MSNQSLSVIVDRADLPELFGKLVDDKPAIESILNNIETESRSITFDIETKEGQATCRSLAAKIASAKSTLDKAGKAKKDEYTVTADQIQKDRNLVKGRLQSLQDEIRKPLTELEQREKERKAQHEKNLEKLVDFTDLVGCESVEYQDRIKDLQDRVIGEDWEEYKPEALEAKDRTLKALRIEFEAVKQREDEQAELARLRAENAKREQQEREERIKQEATAKAKSEAERQAQQVAQEVERKEREAKEREARLIAEKQAAELRAKQDAIDAIENERKRVEAEQAAIAKAEAKRAANKKHRDAIFFKAKDDLIANGVDEETAKTIIKLIHANKISNISINF